MATRLTAFIGDFKQYIFANGNETPIMKRLREKAAKLLSRFKDTIRETLQLEDYEEEGTISAASFLESFNSLQIEGVDSELLDFLLFLLYKQSGTDNTE